MNPVNFTDPLGLKKVIINGYSAVGGPENPQIGSDGFTMTPTDEGEYVIYGSWKHTSTRYPYWSGIPWGTPIRKKGQNIEIFMKNKWQPLKNFTSATYQEIEDYYNDLYGEKKIPSEWVFNDFGHITCFFYKDLNNNNIFDSKKERIHGEFIHTSPNTEALTKLKKPINTNDMGISHGCIHVKPEEIDEMIRKGYLKRGYKFIVHSYKEKLLDFKLDYDPAGKPPYEVHFFPGEQAIIIVGEK